ncbi:MAG: hypothetical protein C0616_00725 [Desulfuromonas sp.]|nr:MAG: hypothetical protein C0616_00725 [Desulfuromonas sp.]
MTRNDTNTIAMNAPAKTERNPIANVWLGVLTVVFALFATCTLVLVAWPVLAWLGANFQG